MKSIVGNKFFKASRLQCALKPQSVRCLFIAEAPSPKVLSTRPLSNWMFGLGGMVACMVAVGGVTRLTRSGLSMTDWKLQGSLPPMSLSEWEAEFSRYKTFPEAQQRQSMTLSEFKSIYFWEYCHRMMGRTVGLAFALPFTYFVARGMIPRALYPRLGALFALGGGQGLIGWWMVKSGLEMDPQQQKEIRVSPYRLATHLTLAFTTYALLLWTGLELRLPVNKYNAATSSALSATEATVSVVRTTMNTLAARFSREQLQRATKVRRAGVVATALVAATAFSGAFVAGNDAGRAYNTFPKMGDEWVPSSVLELQPLWRNFFENTACVQFDHRVLAMSSAAAITSIFLAAYPQALGACSLRRSSPEAVGKALKAVGRMTAVQVSLGVGTLLLVVPTELAVAHQAGAIGLLSLLLRLVHALNYTKEDVTPDLASVEAARSSREVRMHSAAAAAAATTATATATATPVRSTSSTIIGSGKSFSTLCKEMQRTRGDAAAAALGAQQTRTYSTARASFAAFATQKQHHQQ